MRSCWRVLPLFLIAVAALASGVDVPKIWADENEIPFDVANFFVQLNDTDGDLGFHAQIDGEAWTLLKIEDPNEVVLLEIRNIGPLQQQGLTELFFESAEPPFDELSPELFFDRFPEGEYKISGLTIEGDEMKGTVDFTHVMPAPPKIIKPAPTIIHDVQLPSGVTELKVPEVPFFLGMCHGEEPPSSMKLVRTIDEGHASLIRRTMARIPGGQSIINFCSHAGRPSEPSRDVFFAKRSQSTH